MTHLLQFQKVQPTSSYDSVSYKSVLKINDEVFTFYIEKNAWKNSKYSINFFHNNSWKRIFGADYSSAKKAMIDCQIHINHLINKIN
jgi:hypothetical protein